MKQHPFPKLYAETARHPDNIALLNALGASITSRLTCGGKHTKGRKCQYCQDPRPPQP